MLRANITDEEWRQLRIASLESGVSVTEILAGLIREYLQREEAK
jgi:hypothetical protein